MQAIFTAISILITLMTGGFSLPANPDSTPDPQNTASSSQAEDESDGGPGADPWG